MVRFFVAVLLIAAMLSGCACLDISEKGLRIDKDTHATVEDLGVGKINRSF